MLVGVVSVECLSGGASVAAHVAQEGSTASVKSLSFPVVGNDWKSEKVKLIWSHQTPLRQSSLSNVHCSTKAPTQDLLMHSKTGATDDETNTTSIGWNRWVIET